MRKATRRIELLSPAKNLECGIEAIKHGADAVYIGAPKFSARAAAGNSIEDIRLLCSYAHQFDAKVYAALNTILKDDELEEAERLIQMLYPAGIDALIIQDMGIMQMNLPPIPLHASTQMDNRTPGKVKFLEEAGFAQVVLARELSLDQIRQIAELTDVPLEAFVHGSLCVSYSGQCYLSAALCGRSANRGECAQYCRLPYTMVDADGKVIASEKYLLSLKDMNRSGDLEDLLDAGVSSFKIEGRLKDLSYVKNITAYYRKRLDNVFSRRSEYVRTSTGRSVFYFEPVAEKSFNRGFSNYFLRSRTNDIASFDTPKSMGEYVGYVKEIRRNALVVAGSKPLGNGDGLVFFNAEGRLEGFRANKVENGNLVFPQEMPSLSLKTQLYRNFDQQFEKTLAQRPSAERRIAVDIGFFDNPFGFTLCMADESGAKATVTLPFHKEPAQSGQQENIRKQLAKLGQTVFEAKDISVSMAADWFVPSSFLAEIRRSCVDKLLCCRRLRYRREWRRTGCNTASESIYPDKRLSYLGNISNKMAAAFYKRHGVEQADKAFELKPEKNVPLMFSRHCLRYSMGWCPIYQEVKPHYKEPYYLTFKENRLRLDFDCKECIMRLSIINNHS